MNGLIGAARKLLRDSLPTENCVLLLAVSRIVTRRWVKLGHARRELASVSDWDALSSFSADELTRTQI